MVFLYMIMYKLTQSNIIIIDIVGGEVGCKSLGGIGGRARVGGGSGKIRRGGGGKILFYNQT